jgi:hypothetical protein
MTESDSDLLMVEAAQLLPSYMVTDFATPYRELTGQTKDIFGEVIAPLEIEFLNACQRKATPLEKWDGETHIWRLAEILTPELPYRGEKFACVPSAFNSICDSVKRLTLEYRDRIQEEKKTAEELLEAFRSTTPASSESFLDWGDHAGYDIQHHAKLEKVKGVWQARSAAVLRNVYTDSLLDEAKNAVEKLNLPIWQQLLVNNGIQQIEAELKSKMGNNDSMEPDTLKQDITIEVPARTRTEGTLAQLNPNAVHTRLSIALIHLSCCKAEKDRNFKYNKLQGTFVPEDEVSLQESSVPPTPRSTTSLLSLQASSVASTGKRKQRSPDIVTDRHDWNLGWTKEQRHEIYGEALDNGTIVVPGIAAWKKGWCFINYRTGECNKNNGCTFKEVSPEGLDLENRQVPICSHLDDPVHPCATRMCRLLHYNWDYVQAKLAAAKQNAKSAAGKVAKNTRQDEVEELEGENIAKRLNMSGGQ